MITSESIQMMDCDDSMDDYSAVDLVGGIQHSYLFLDPTKSNEDNSDLFLKHHLRLSYAQMTVQAKYHRLCFEYFFIALEKDTPVCWVLYFRNFCIKVRKEIKNYNRRSYLNEVAKKYSLDLSNLTDKDVKSILSSEDKDNLNRIDNQVRSMNGSVWHCAATVFAIYRDFFAVNRDNLSMELEYRVSEQIVCLFTSNSTFMSALSMSAEADMRDLAYICRTMKDNKNQRTQFGSKITTRKKCMRVPRKDYKGMSIKVGSKRKERSLKSTTLQSTLKKSKRSNMDENLRSDDYSTEDEFVKSLGAAQDELKDSILMNQIFGDNESITSQEDMVGLTVDSNHLASIVVKGEQYFTQYLIHHTLSLNLYSHI